MSRTGFLEPVDRLDPEDKRAAMELLSYPEETAGALMMKEYIAVPRDRRLSDIREEFRNRSE